MGTGLFAQGCALLGVRTLIEVDPAGKSPSFVPLILVAATDHQIMGGGEFGIENMNVDFDASIGFFNCAAHWCQPIRRR